MQEIPLTTAAILRHATNVHGAAEVVTWSGAAARRTRYCELGRRAAQLAHGLRSLGIDGDQRVATFLWNDSEHLEFYAAVPSMGAVLHTLNIRLPAEQITYIVNHAADEVIAVDVSLLGTLAPLLGEMPTVKHVIVVGAGDVPEFPRSRAAVHRYEDLLVGQPEVFRFEVHDEYQAAAMCYTSGTTGNPKGVVYSHRSIYLHSMQLCAAESFGIRRGDRVLSIVPMFHAMAWGLPYAAMLCGADQLLPQRFLQAAPLIEFIRRERPTLSCAVPAVLFQVLTHLDQDPVPLSGLREFVVGGSACPPALMEGMARHGISVVQGWGMTEMSPMGSIARRPANWPEEVPWPRQLSQGLLYGPVEGRIVTDDGVPCKSDDVSIGELEVRGPWITGKYYEPPDADVRHDAAFHDGWLRTGDVGTLSPDGYLTLSDRAKDVIKSGGEWISSVDLENLVMSHPAVAEAAVIGVPDLQWDERPLVVVVPRTGLEISFSELRDFVAARVARWQVPENWTRLAEVPKTSVGKFDKKAIRALHGAGSLNVVTIR